MKNSRKFNQNPKKLTLDIYTRTVKFFMFLFEKKLHKNIKYDFFESRDSKEFIIAMKKLDYDYTNIEHLLFAKRPLVINGKIMKSANDAIKEEMLKCCNSLYPDKFFNIEFIYTNINEFLFKYRINIYENEYSNYLDSEILKSFESEFIDIFKESLDNNEIYLKTNIFKI